MDDDYVGYVSSWIYVEFVTIEGDVGRKRERSKYVYAVTTLMWLSSNGRLISSIISSKSRMWDSTIRDDIFSRNVSQCGRYGK